MVFLFRAIAFKRGVAFLGLTLQESKAICKLNPTNSIINEVSFIGVMLYYLNTYGMTSCQG